MSLCQNEDLEQSREAATDRSKHPKQEGSAKDDHHRNLPSGNGSGCIEDAVASQHSRSAEAQEQKTPACRASGEHREQSLHGFTIVVSGVRGESHKELAALSPFEGGYIGSLVVS